MTEKFRNTKNIIQPQLQYHQQTKLRKQNNFNTSLTQKDLELVRLREALIGAIQQNQILRSRVIEMEALLAAAEQQIQNTKNRYVQDLNRMHNWINNKNQNQTQYPTKTRRKSL